MPWQVIALPLFGAVAYAVSATLLKRVSRSNVDPWRITVFTNVVSAAAMQSLWLLPSPPPPPPPEGGEGPGMGWLLLVAQAAGPAVLFTAGQMFTVLAIQHGDVSVATPLMGAKVLFVAALTVLLLGQPQSWQLWAAAALATAAVALLRGRRAGRHKHVGRTVLFALGGSMMFAATDVLVQRFGPPWGAARFVPIMFTLVALSTLPLTLLFEKTRPNLLAGSRRVLWFASLFYAMQVMCMAYTLSQFGEATTVNILFSSRGIWGVVLAWTLGPLVGLQEHHHGRAVFFKRLTAALLIIVAIVLTVTR